MKHKRNSVLILRSPYLSNVRTRLRLPGLVKGPNQTEQLIGMVKNKTSCSPIADRTASTALVSVVTASCFLEQAPWRISVFVTSHIAYCVLCVDMCGG